MMTMKRTLAKGWPVLLLTATLSLPAVTLAAPSPNAKAHAADRWDKQQDKDKGKKNKEARKRVEERQREAAKRQAELRREEQKRQAELRRAAEKRLREDQKRQAELRRNTERQQRQFEAQRRAELQRQATLQQQLRLQREAEVRRQAELTRQATLQRQVRLQQEAELRRQAASRAPVYQADRFRNRPWYGWQTRRGYSRFGSGSFQLDGTFIGQQHGCALVQDHQGQVIPLLSNPGDLRRGEHLLLSGRIQSSSVCGTAFRVFSVDQIWTDASHRRLVFDRRQDGEYSSERFDDRYNRYDDDYDDRYDSDNRRLISVEGELDRNLVCTSLRADDGERYGLSGDLRDFRDGDFVRVVGFLEGRSFCGGRTIDVQEIHG